MNNNIERNKIFVKEALEKIPLWRQKRSALKSFFLIPQKTYIKNGDIRLGKIENLPKVTRDCLIKLGECEINSRLFLKPPEIYARNEEYIQIGDYRGLNKNGPLLHLLGDCESIFIDDSTSKNIELISDDLALLLAVETM